ncbi:hypothetical protein [Azospirillum sp. ST 5-10]|uniref:hypothetical protein n=1 Tax=unclassified Azospirillum TaxID=2630922 RepID=UPI003F49BADB
MKFVWGCVFVACVLGTFGFVADMQAAQSAPQQAAAAAMALFIIVTPYVCARALEKLAAKPAMAVTVTNWPAPPKAPMKADEHDGKAARLRPNDLVSHPVRGEGVVIRTEDDGFVIVQFAGTEARMDPDWLKRA